MGEQACLKLMVTVYSGLTERGVHLGPMPQFLPILKKLTEDHFQLNPRSRMRNKLAEVVLDKKMLILMKVDSFL